MFMGVLLIKINFIYLFDFLKKILNLILVNKNLLFRYF